MMIRLLIPWLVLDSMHLGLSEKHGIAARKQSLDMGNPDLSS